MIINDQDIQSALINHVADLDEDRALDLVRQRLDNGDDPLAIAEDCQMGLRLVGERYEQRTYYLSGLIMAGEIFRRVMELLLPPLEQRITRDESGYILLGTVQGDIHDIGKNNLSLLLRCYGFTVDDLGVDVPPEKFLEQASRAQPDIIGMSGLLSISREAMHKTVKLIKDSPDPSIASTPIIIGGGLLNKQICEYVNADYWATDAMTGVRICRELAAKKAQR